MQYDYLIVGAGLFGCVFARQMTDAGKKCLVIDKRNHIGGNAYTREVNSIQVHEYGPHIFHTARKNVWNYANRFAEFNHFHTEPVANYKGELYNLPFNMNTFHQMWGVITPSEAKAEIEKQRAELSGREPTNLEEQAISLVGRDIYERLIKGYTEKQWGRPCSELPAFIIRRLPVRFRYDNNYFNDPYQGIPISGYTAMIEKMLEGIDVRLGIDYLENREELRSLAKKIIYTGTIDGYFDFSLGTLEYRSLRFESEFLPETDNYQGIAIMNFTDSQTPYTRIIEHKHFTFSEGKGTVITREYSSTWKPGDEPYYPVNDAKNQELYQRYRELALHEKGVLFGGRLGEYRYYNMDEVIARALEEAAKEIENRVYSELN